MTNPIFPEVKISPDLNGLQPLLQRLDRLIAQAISVLQTQRQAEEELEVSWLQKTEMASEQTSIQIREDSLLAWLQNTFSLSPFDLDILAIALAPELDCHYERVYVYLQDEMSNKRPTVDLVLNLLCSIYLERHCTAPQSGDTTPRYLQRSRISRFSSSKMGLWR